MYVVAVQITAQALVLDHVLVDVVVDVRGVQDGVLRHVHLVAQVVVPVPVLAAVLAVAQVPVLAAVPVHVQMLVQIVALEDANLVAKEVVLPVAMELVQLHVWDGTIINFGFHEYVCDNTRR